MAYLFNAQTFALQLKETHCEDGDYRLNEMMLSYDEKERKERKRLFDICHRVMKAENLSEIDDISIEDIVSCIRVHEDYEQLYRVKKFAGAMFPKFERRLRNVKTVRRRRVL